MIKAIRLSNIHTIYVPAEIDVDQLRRKRVFEYHSKELVEDLERDAATGQFPIELWRDYDEYVDVVCEFTCRVPGGSSESARPASTPAPTTPSAAAPAAPSTPVVTPWVTPPETVATEPVVMEPVAPEMPTPTEMPTEMQPETAAGDIPPEM